MSDALRQPRFAGDDLAQRRALRDATAGWAYGSPVFQDARILVVDDQRANVVALKALLSQWRYTRVETATDGHAALRLCEAQQPDLVLLDLHMPGLDGFAVMDRLRRHSRGRVSLPILALTADVTAETRRRALEGGARDFLTKPFDPEEVRLRVHNLLEIRALQLQQAATEASLEARVRQRTAELCDARLEMLHRLAVAAEFRDDLTGEHTARVGRTSSLLAAALGLGADEVERIALAAPLHDVGKIGVSDGILLKPGRLTSGERRLMERHTLLGCRILQGSTSDLLQVAESIALAHHERWDGTGYPHGLAGEDIPLAGRVVAIADVFDALTHARPYKEAWPLHDAVEHILGERGQHFDPVLVDAFAGLNHAALL